MKRTIFAAGSLAAALLLAHPAFSPAQENLPPAIQLGAMEVHPYLMLTGTWNDNVYATADNEKSDFITTITPGLGLKLPFRAHQITLGAHAEFARYADFTELDTDSFQADALGEFNIGERLNLKVGDTFLRAYESLLESPTKSSDRYDANIASISAKYSFVDVTQLRLDYVLTTLDYRDDDARSRTEGRFSAYLYYRVLPKTSAFLEYDYTSEDYDEATSTLDSAANSGQIGAIWEISAISKGTAKVGFQAKKFDDAGIDDYSTWVASVEMTHALSDMVQLHLVGARLVNEAKYAGPSYYTTTGLTGELTVWFLDRLAGIVSASYGRNEFSDPIVGDSEVRKDDRYTAGLGARYNFNTWLSFEAEYTNINRDSNIDKYSATENALSLRVKAAL